MLVLLPPSETKHAGGDGPPLTSAALSFPELDPLRKELVDELVELAGDVAASRAALGLSPRQDEEIARNAALWASPTLPALHRYTGVLYDALDAASLRGAAADRARARLMVGSALFGLLRATDPVPAYRLSAGCALPGRPTLAARWRPLLEPVLAALAAGDSVVVDLRSGAYAALARVPGAVTVTVLAERAGGARSVVSHFNKAHKGRLARVLATTRAEPSDVAGVAAVARRAGMRVERTGALHLDVIVPARDAVAAGRPAEGACTDCAARLPAPAPSPDTARRRAGSPAESGGGAACPSRPGTGRAVPPFRPPDPCLAHRAAGGHPPVWRSCAARARP